MAKRIEAVTMKSRVPSLERLVIGVVAYFATFAMPLVSTSAHAFDLDWSGQFRSEAFFIQGYTQDSDSDSASPDGDRIYPAATPATALDGTPRGYYIPGGGSRNANFQTLFLRLRPKLIVNDNIYIKSEWWVGDPIFGLFGNAAPYNVDQRQWYSNHSGGSFITAQRFWGEFLSDIGTVYVGRAPLNWGLGLVWNSGDGLWDRYMSTGDMVGIVTKFGSFTFAPSYVKYGMGNTVGGACNLVGGACSTVLGSGDVQDLSLAFKYENPDEELEAGVNFVKRITGAAQDENSGFFGYDNSDGAAGANYNTYSIYAKKKLGPISLGVEVPIVSGELAGSEYSTLAFAFEGKWDITDRFDTTVRLGHAPGQENLSGAKPDSFKAFYFHPNYKLGLMMFNLQFANLAGVQTRNDPESNPRELASPYDNPIVNANYLAVGAGYRLSKWRFHTNFIFANANESCSGSGSCYNVRARRFEPMTAGADEQSKSLGWEMDYGVSFQWDETFTFGTDIGWYFPGDFYAFSNVAGKQNATDSVFATVLKVGVNF